MFINKSDLVREILKIENEVKNDFDFILNIVYKNNILKLKFLNQEFLEEDFSLLYNFRNKKFEEIKFSDIKSEEILNIFSVANFIILKISEKITELRKKTFFEVLEITLNKKFQKEKILISSNKIEIQLDFVAFHIVEKNITFTFSQQELSNSEIEIFLSYKEKLENILKEIILI